MRKLILGIIAVICLDVAFIVYPGIREPAKVAYPAVNYGPRNVAELSDQRFSDELAVVSNEESPDEPDELSAVERKVVAARASRNAGNNGRYSMRVRNDRRSLNQQALFKPVVITVGQTNSTSKAASFDRPLDLPERLKKDGPELRSDDRSLVSTLMPIVKKPYEWIKFIGSKLK